MKNAKNKSTGKDIISVTIVLKAPAFLADCSSKAGVNFIVQSRPM